MSVREIHQQIYDEFQIDSNHIKGKTNLIEYYNNLNKGQIVEKDFLIDEELLVRPSIGIKYEDTKITRTSPNWTKYILDQLEEDEKDNNFPKSDGLRRLLEINICPISNIQTSVIQFPCPDNNMIATCRSTISLENGESYEAIADAQAHTLPEPYDKYVSAIAETRAEGRVYRKALRLKNVVTKEEIDTGNSTQIDSINSTQINLIDTLCGNGKLNININKFLQTIFPDKNIDNINKLSHNDGTKICQILTEYQKDINKVSSEIRGYIPNWKN